jgi:hypothetical protein
MEGTCCFPSNGVNTFSKVSRHALASSGQSNVFAQVSGLTFWRRSALPRLTKELIQAKLTSKLNANTYKFRAAATIKEHQISIAFTAVMPICRIPLGHCLYTTTLTEK